MTPFFELAGERITHLAEAFRHLHDRVRAAVAGEMARAVGDALRDWLATVLSRHLPDTPSFPPASPLARRHWNDDDPDDDAAEWPDPPESPPTMRTFASSPATAPRSSITTASRQRRWPLLAGLGLLAGLATLCPHPLVHAAVALATAAAELLAITESRLL